MSEWDLREQDTSLAAPLHQERCHPGARPPDRGEREGLPALSIWVTIAPDNPIEREDVIITAISAAKATVRRDVGYTEPLAHPKGTPVRLAVRAGAYAEDWRIIQHFQNGWKSAGGSNPKAAYKRLPSGLVILRGSIQSGTIGRPHSPYPAATGRPTASSSSPATATAPTGGSTSEPAARSSP